MRKANGIANIRRVKKCAHPEIEEASHLHIEKLQVG
jgi:hypothetical protein